MTRLTAEDVLRMLEFGKTQIDRMDYCERLAEKANAIIAQKEQAVRLDEVSMFQPHPRTGGSTMTNEGKEVGRSLTGNTGHRQT